MSGKRLQVGDTFENFTYNTPFETGKNFYDKIGDKPAFVLFLRYYGCTICQLDMKNLVQKYKNFTDKGTDILVVLQSDPAIVRKGVKEGDFPYDIVCDTDMGLYKKYDLGVAKSPEEMVKKDDEYTQKRFAELQASGLEHGEYEGEEMQLPAVFKVDKDKKVTYAHYAAHLTDMPTLDELAEMA